METRRRKSDVNKMLGLAGIALILIILYLVIGLNERNLTYALTRRIPKVYTMILVGGGIGLSSLIFQTVTHNHILTPSVLGLDSLYMLLNTALVFFLGSSNKWIVNSNNHFLLTLMVMLVCSILFYLFVFKRQAGNIYFLLLVGIVVGTLFESFTTFMQVLIDPSEFLSIQDKSQASFNQINTGLLGLTTVMMGLALIYCRRFLQILDVMALGRMEAISLGVDYEQTVKRMLLAVVILTATSTALVGPITFLGLLVVNIARYFIKSYKHKDLSRAIWLLSIVVLVGGQLIAERVLKFGVSVSLIINFVGGIYFIYLLLKGRTQ